MFGTRKDSAWPTPQPIEKGDARHKRDLFRDDLGIGWKQRGTSPLIHGMQMPAIQASRSGELGAAVGTDCGCLKGIECPAAVGAFPIRADRRRSVAAGTLKAVTPRKFG